ncbi:CatB-related O-acetyltransferase [Terasakiella sp.]|uniref:CatB-related O-acetyltransferase n=1 Tax=Terasakiella sp. TaxID=2034861 RepID=UPI003AA99253
MSEGAYNKIFTLLAKAGWEEDGWDLDIVNHNIDTGFFMEAESKVPFEQFSSSIENFFIGRNSYILNGGLYSSNTIIGRYCSISKDVYLGNTNHDFNCLSTSFVPDDPGFQSQRVKGYNIVGCDVWIAANSIVLQGLTIGHGAVVGAGSVVTKDVPPYAIVAGNPARIIKYRFAPQIIEGLLETKWWTLPDSIIRQLPAHDVEMCIEGLRAARRTTS